MSETPICTDCNRPIDHAGDNWWYTDRPGEICCAPCTRARSPLAVALAQRDAAILERDTLRAILAPLLDNPTYDGDGIAGAYIGCKFCTMTLFWRDPKPEQPHDAGCPVLDAPRLLGRESPS